MDVIVKIYPEPKIDRDAVLKYAGCKEADESILKLLNECIFEARLAFNYRVAYKILPICVSDSEVDFNLFKTTSKSLVKALDGCENSILFAASVGFGIDRLIRKYSLTSPAKALMFQALGTERVEKLCDIFSKDIAKELSVKTKRRVSPGYGDIPLKLQENFFSILDCPRWLSLSLNENMLITPTKSVTAFIGVKK
ncbi:MAG: hypothetical protein IIX18_04245 [Clostridia bacterium]|nr:hypothetical protein [Clostridia bacterium]